MSGQLHPRERAPGTHWIGGWVGPRVGLDDVKNRKFLTLPGLEFRPIGRPARNQLLYQLPYPGSILDPEDFEMEGVTVTHVVFAKYETRGT
jgi:hypothetical protein